MLTVENLKIDIKKNKNSCIPRRGIFEDFGIAPSKLYKRVFSWSP